MDETHSLPRRIREAARELVARVHELPYEILQAKSQGDEWSVREIVIQYADNAIVQSERVRRMIAEEHPVLQAVDKDKWAHGLSFAGRSLEISLRLMEVLSDGLADLLESLSDADWRRNGFHPAHGEATVIGLARQLVDEARETRERLENVVRHLG